MAPKQIKNKLLLSDKLKLIEKMETGMRKCDVARIHDVPASTVRHIWETRNDIKRNIADGYEKQKPVIKYEQIDNRMIEWFNDMRKNNIPVSGPMLKEKALECATELNFPEFRASNGWCEKFKKRYV